MLELRFFNIDDLEKPKKVGFFNTETFPLLGNVVQIYGKKYQVQQLEWVLNDKDNYIYLGVVSLELSETEKENEN